MARIVPGVRNKQKLLQEFCADCGATDPGWSSLNRGILLCDGCCSVHRSLGRHVSQVKPLQKIIWHPTQLSMVHALNNSGANHIWEHMLLDPSTAKDIRHKPQPKDPIHPNKADFIRAKHQMLSFVYRLNKEESTGVDKDVSRQLHASVRTANLETSLRLLSLGADPNYFNAEKGNCPLHVAATAGQSSQVELLVIYGADPGALDDDGQSPVDYAREGCSQELADRLIEFQYELTDRLTFYVCGRKPHHSDNQHWVIPEMADTLIDSAEVSTDARDRLVALPNHSFEELACDVYDEVDRRETDGIWLSLQNQSALLSDRCSVPFLPVNPEYSSTRNQGRQKLARFNAREFATLIIDILVEARRRMADSVSHPHLLAKETDKKDATVTPVHPTQHTLTNISNASPCSSDRNNAYRQTCPSISSRHDSPSHSTFNTTQSQPSLNSHATSVTALQPLHCTSATPTHPIRPIENDDEPLYDSVASEDDYSSWERRKKIHTQEILDLQSRTTGNPLQDPDYQGVVNCPEKEQRETQTTVSLNEYLEMKRHLDFSESRIKELRDNNVFMTTRLNELSTMIHTLKEENVCLRLQGVSPSSASLPWDAPPPCHPQTTSRHGTPTHSLRGSPNNRSYSPFSDSNLSLQNGDCSPTKSRLGDVGGVSPAGVKSPKQHRRYSMFEARGRSEHSQSLSTCSDTFANPYSYESTQCAASLPENTLLLVNLPSQNEVVRKTEMITKRIQELLLSAQDSQHERFVPCSDQINFAVREMSDLFPKSGCPGELLHAVHQLVMSAARLQGECRNHVTSQLHILDPSRATQQVIQCAYDIAKAAKNLVTHFQ